LFTIDRRFEYYESHCRGVQVNYSYTPIGQYRSYPRRYRHRYADGWQEQRYTCADAFLWAFEEAIAHCFANYAPGQSTG